MSAVPVAISRCTAGDNLVDAFGRPSAEIDMRIVDPRVDYVRVDIRGGRIVGVRPAQGQRLLIAAIEAPGGARLCCDGCSDLVGLDEPYAWISRDCCGGCTGEIIYCEALEC
jgi:hypothetical protein